MNKSYDEMMKLTQEEFYKITTDYNPTYNLLRLCRNNGYYYMGYFIGSILKKTNTFAHLDELAICAYYVGEYQESVDICNCILDNNLCPEKDRLRIEQNKKFSENMLRAEHGIYD
jgi:hypothetical protein